MANRQVKLEIVVDDRDVKDAEASINRLATATKKVELNEASRKHLAANKADYLPDAALKQQQALATFLKKDMPAASKEAETAIDGVKEASSEMGAETAATTGILSRMAAALGPVGIAVIAVTALIAAAAVVMYQLGQAVLKITKQFADYALDVGKASEANGLAAGTIAALRHEADAQGRSIQNLDGIMANFRKTIGEAVAGSEEARAGLNLLGIDGKKAIFDIDEAFRQAITSIVKMPAGLKQMQAGFAVFGPEFYKLLPFFKEFNGDIDALQRKAEELGIHMSGKSVSDAREFNRAYEDVKKVVQGLTNTFGREFLPGVTSALKTMGEWIVRNKEEIKGWAVWAGEWVQYIVDKFTLLGEKLAQMRRDARDMADVEIRNQGGYVPPRYDSPTALPIQPQSFGITQPQANLDPAAVAAMMATMREKAEEMSKAREASAKAELGAQIQLYERTVSELEKLYRDKFTSITSELKETLNIAQYESSFKALQEWYGGEIEKLEPMWTQLVMQRTLDEKKGAMEQTLIKRELEGKLQEIRQTMVDNETAAAKAIKEAREKAAADYLTNQEAQMQRNIELRAAFDAKELAIIQRRSEHGIISTREAATAINEVEMAALEHQKTNLDAYLAKVRSVKGEETAIVQQLAVLEQQILQQKEINQGRLNAIARKEADERQRILDSYRDFKLSLDDQLDAVQRGNKPLTEYERTVRELERGYKGLSQEQKDNLLVVAQQIDAVTELNRQHAEIKGFFNETFRYVFEGDFKGLLRSWQDQFKDKLADQLSETLATNLLGFDPNKTDNPVAKPIVNRIDKTNNILNSILVRLGGTPVTGAAGSIVNTVFGGGQGPGGTPNFNPGAGGQSSGGGGIFERLFGGGGGGGGLLTSHGREGGGGFGQGSGRVPGEETAGGAGGLGGLFGNFKKMFGPRRNLLTGNDSALAGKMGGIGDIASMVGGFLPGRLGSTLQYAGMGASLGANFGPWGAAIGAGVGALFGLFGGGRDKSIARLREAALSEYALTVKDKTVLNALKNVGEQYFGKGKAGENAVAVVRLDESISILRNYAEMTGQNGDKIDLLKHTDPEWSGNQFRSQFGGYRERGGSVRANMAYVVGERRPELFVPSVNGTIMPAVPNVTTTSGNAAAASRVDRELMAGLAESIYRLQETVDQFSTQPAGVIVREGAGAASAAIANANQQAYVNDWRQSENLGRNTGR